MFNFHKRSPEPNPEKNPTKKAEEKPNPNPPEDLTPDIDQSMETGHDNKSDFGEGFGSGLDWMENTHDEFPEGNKETQIEAFEPKSPIIGPYIDDKNVEYTFQSNRSYFFLFGPTSTGKSGILLSLYRYLSTQRTGDSFKNINNPKTPYEQLGNLLISNFIEDVHHGNFPAGTTKIEINKYPIHLNFRFKPGADKKKPEIEFCLMDMSGEDLARIDYSSRDPLPESIKTYVEDLPPKNLRFIYVIDPQEARYKKYEQVKFFNAFINMVDLNNHTQTPVLLLVTKWDIVKEYNSVEEYIKKEFEEIWRVITDRDRRFDFGKYSVGEVNNAEKKIISFDYNYPRNLFNWIYQQHTGETLDSNEDRNLWDRILKLLNF